MNTSTFICQYTYILRLFLFFPSHLFISRPSFLSVPPRKVVETQIRGKTMSTAFPPLRREYCRSNSLLLLLLWRRRLSIVQGGAHTIPEVPGLPTSLSTKPRPSNKRPQIARAKQCFLFAPIHLNTIRKKMKRDSGEPWTAETSDLAKTRSSSSSEQREAVPGRGASHGDRDRDRSFTGDAHAGGGRGQGRQRASPPLLSRGSRCQQKHSS